MPALNSSCYSNRYKRTLKLCGMGQVYVEREGVGQEKIIYARLSGLRLYGFNPYPPLPFAIPSHGLKPHGGHDRFTLCLSKTRTH